MGIPGLTVRLINRGHWITMEQLPHGQELERQDLDQQGQYNEQQESQQQSQYRDQQQNQQQSKPQSKQQKRQQSQCSVAIIDGPGLAYCIGHEYREENLANTSTELSPAYGEIGARTIRFLEDMEAVGLKM